MRIVAQRVSSAEVKVENGITGNIGKGILIYTGFEKTDSQKEIDFLAEKVLNLRIFPDKKGKMDKSILDIRDGSILSVSQFTLASFIKKGRRPDFSNALEPEKAEELYDLFNLILARQVKVEKGIFGAMMEISSVNDGPVTFILEKRFENP